MTVVTLDTEFQTAGSNNSPFVVTKPKARQAYRFEVLSMVTMKMTVFLIVAPCRLVLSLPKFLRPSSPDDSGSRGL